MHRLQKPHQDILARSGFELGITAGGSYSLPPVISRAHNMKSRKRVSGMTLIELMVVVAIVAILGSIAVNSYRSYLIRTNRTEGRMALLRIQAAQEKFFLQKNTYAANSDFIKAPPDGLGVPATTPSGYYTISIEDFTATTYTAVATAAGGQLDDITACKTLKINQNGARSPADSSGCWR